MGEAANAIMKECLERFPKIMGPEQMTPDYEKCIRISTNASLRKMGMSVSVLEQTHDVRRQWYRG